MEAGKGESMRASDRAYRTLLTEIQDGLLPAGAVLGEVEQAARLGALAFPVHVLAKNVGGWRLRRTWCAHTARRQF